MPRRETTRAKKIDEIHAEAEQALGVTIPKDTFTMGARGGAKDVELFPALRSDVGGNGAGARYTHKTGQGDVSSGLLGTFVPRGAEQEGAGAGPNPNLTEEELDRKVQSLIDEYVQVGDEKEAVTCVAEINVTHLPAMSKVRAWCPDRYRKSGRWGGWAVPRMPGSALVVLTIFLIVCDST